MKTMKDFFSNDRYAELTGVEIINIKEGESLVRMLVEEKHLNGNNTCQGGAIFTLADLAFALATNSHKRITVTANASIHFVHAATKGYLYAQGKEIVNANKLPYGEVRVTNEQDELIAVFTATGYRTKGEIDCETLL